jgi:hypothetical protein
MIHLCEHSHDPFLNFFTVYISSFKIFVTNFTTYNSTYISFHAVSLFAAEKSVVSVQVQVQGQGQVQTPVVAFSLCPAFAFEMYGLARR